MVRIGCSLQLRRAGYRRGRCKVRRSARSDQSRRAAFLQVVGRALTSSGRERKRTGLRTEGTAPTLMSLLAPSRLRKFELSLDYESPSTTNHDEIQWRCSHRVSSVAPIPRTDCHCE